MDFPQDVDCVIIGTGLAESVLASSLATLGYSLLHLDRQTYYGGFLAALQFPEFKRSLTSWATNCDIPSFTPGDFNLVDTCSQLQRNCSSEYFLRVVLNDCELEPPTETCNASNAWEETVPSTEEAVSSGSDQSPLRSAHETKRVFWTVASLDEALRRVEIDIMPKLLFADSPTVSGIVRSDVTRYLEFRFITRLLFCGPEDAHPNKAGGCAEHSTKLIKIPVSRGEVFKTRMLTLAQKRLFVGFLEWCMDCLDGASIDAPVSIETDVDHFMSPQDRAYLDLPLAQFLKDRRNLDDVLTHLIINCFSLATDLITLRQAVPRIQRLLTSMNRYGPYPLLRPLYGCGDVSQSYCRMSAVFGGVYCLNSTLCSLVAIDDNEAASQTVPTATERTRALRRKLNLLLSSGNWVRTASLVISAENLPSAWILPQVKRWISRAVWITDSSLFPEALTSTDISLLPIPISGRGEAIIEPAFLIELPIERGRQSPNLFIVHVIAASSECVKPETLFNYIRNMLFYINTEEPITSETRPRLLWAAYFSLPDLSEVSLTSESLFANGESTSSMHQSLAIAPGLDSSLFLDSCMEAARVLFNRIDTSQPGMGEAMETEWDGVFPPRPRLVEERASGPEGMLSSPTFTYNQPSAIPVGHGDWTRTQADQSHFEGPDDELQ